MKHIYSIDSGDLVVKDNETSTTIWRGRFENTPVYKIIPLGERCLVLLDPGNSGKPTFDNLLLINSFGQTLWKAQPPQSNDAFADVTLTLGGVEANTWYGVRVSVDIDSGHTKKIGFCK